MKKSWSTESFELSTDTDQFRMTDRRSAAFECRPQPKTAIELGASAPKLLRTARKVTLLVVQRRIRSVRIGMSLYESILMMQRQAISTLNLLPFRVLTVPLSPVFSSFFIQGREELPLVKQEIQSLAG